MKKREIDAALGMIAAGDNGAFERLYVETKGGVYAFLYSYFDNRADCEDAVQTVYLKIKTNISQYRVGTNGLAWILQIAKNTALSTLRTEANARKAQGAACEASYETSDNAMLKNSLMSAMKRALDEDEQRIIVLHTVWGYKHKEIAEMLGCPIGTVTSKYKRAVDKMKTALKEEKQ